MEGAVLGLLVGTVFLVSSFILRGDDPTGMLAIFGSIFFGCGLFLLALELL